MSLHLRSRSVLFILLLSAALLLVVAVGTPRVKAETEGPLTVESIEFLGMVTFETGYQFAGTEVGGLSGITFDDRHGLYYTNSDDRTNPRYYTVDIDLSDGSLDDGDVTFQDVTFLRDRGNRSFPDGFVDPESIELVRPGQLYISSEGDADADPPIDPFVNRFNLSGRENRELPIPSKFLPAPDKGIRDNLAFESLGVTPNRERLYTAVENALEQDGPVASVTESSPSRVLEYDLNRKQPQREFVYVVSPIPAAPVPPDAFADNGLVELRALDNEGTFLAMERSFIVGVGNIVKLFETSTHGATNVADLFSLEGASYEPMTKQLVADFEGLGVDPDNLEAMAFGPTLPDGRELLIVVSDNNFNPSQITQFIALAVDLEPAEE